MTGYRHRKATKFTSGGKRRNYKNLATFNKECPSRGGKGGICFTTNVRCLKDGGGLATVHVQPYMGFRREGTWRLHFASCSVMKQHLKKRTTRSRGTLDK